VINFASGPFAGLHGPNHPMSKDGKIHHVSGVITSFVYAVQSTLTGVASIPSVVLSDRRKHFFWPAPPKKISRGWIVDQQIAQHFWIKIVSPRCHTFFLPVPLRAECTLAFHLKAPRTAL
jgi:hypothetical protein